MLREKGMSRGYNINFPFQLSTRKLLKPSVAKYLLRPYRCSKTCFIKNYYETIYMPNSPSLFMIPTILFS